MVEREQFAKSCFFIHLFTPFHGGVRALFQTVRLEMDLEIGIKLCYRSSSIWRET